MYIVKQLQQENRIDTVIDDMFKKIDYQDKSSQECWQWKGQLEQDGYGRYSLSVHGEKRDFQAHNLLYRLLHETELDHLNDVSHICHNPQCCNPNHLTDEPHVKNLRRGVKRDRDSKKTRF